jgi:hypothetical protein
MTRNRDIDPGVPLSFPGLVSGRGVAQAPEFIVSKFGQNLAISGIEDIWSNGGLYPWPSAAATIEVLSGSDDDKSGGAGALTMEVQGLDANFDLASETFTLNGVGVVGGNVTFTRVFRAFVTTTATYGGSNTGLITVRVNTGGATLATIVAAKGQTQLALYTVPAGYTAYMTSIRMHVSTTNDGVSMELFKRLNADDVTTPFLPKRLVTSWEEVVGSLSFEYGWGLKFTEKTDIWFAGTKLGVASDPQATAEFSLYVFKD